MEVSKSAKKKPAGKDEAGAEASNKVQSAMDECLEACLDSFRKCTEQIAHCLTMGGEHAGVDHINLLNSCSTICDATARFMMYGSEFHREICHVCSHVCSACADECERMAGGDSRMLECAAACRRTSEACERMSSH